MKFAKKILISHAISGALKLNVLDVNTLHTALKASCSITHTNIKNFSLSKSRFEREVLWNLYQREESWIFMKRPLKWFQLFQALRRRLHKGDFFCHNLKQKVTWWGKIDRAAARTRRMMNASLIEMSHARLEKYQHSRSSPILIRPVFAQHTRFSSQQQRASAAVAKATPAQRTKAACNLSYS